MKKENEPKLELSVEAMKEIYKEQETITGGIMEYTLPDALEDVAHPLAFGEKRKLKKFDLKKVDSMDDDKMDSLLIELLELRGIKNDVVDALAYSDLQMWVKKVAITTFNTKIIATKK